MNGTLLPQRRPIGVRIGDAKERESSHGDGKLDGTKDEEELGIPPFQVQPPGNLHTEMASLVRLAITSAKMKLEML